MYLIYKKNKLPSTTFLFFLNFFVDEILYFLYILYMKKRMEELEKQFRDIEKEARQLLKEKIESAGGERECTRLTGVSSPTIFYRLKYEGRYPNKKGESPKIQLDTIFDTYRLIDRAQK